MLVHAPSSCRQGRQFVVERSFAVMARTGDGFANEGRALCRSPEATPPQVPASGVASIKLPKVSTQVQHRIVKLCSAIIADKHADQIVKEEAMLLRCDINEMSAGGT